VIQAAMGRKKVHINVVLLTSWEHLRHKIILKCKGENWAARIFVKNRLKTEPSGKSIKEICGLHV